MRLKDLRVADLYDLMDELDEIKDRVDFNSQPFPVRTGVRRMRVYLDHVASGLRMIRGGEYEKHNIEAIHMHKRYYNEG